MLQNISKIIIYDLENKQLSRFYALIKLHKTPITIRPIISNKNSLLKGLSKWVNYHLESHWQHIPSYLRDSGHFITKLKEIPATNDSVLITALYKKHTY